MNKKCSRCNLELSIENFGFQNKAAGLHKSTCKNCCKEYNKKRYDANKEKNKQVARNYQLKNHDKYIEYQRNYNKTKRKNHEV